MIENTRLWIYKPGQPLSDKHYVLYWMQQAQRTVHNHALEWAITCANDHKLPLLVAFALTDDFPEANARHYAFMLDGLRDVHDALRQRHIPFIIKHGSPANVIPPLADNAAILVSDVGYLRIQRQWREQISKSIKCPFTAVESDVVVPVRVTSNKEEYAARTIRPKINRQRDQYLKPLATSHIQQTFTHPPKGDLEPREALDQLKLDRSVPPSSHYPGGQSEARRQLNRFIEHKLHRYADDRNDPSDDISSNMSPYLHFGQISPIMIALAIQEASHVTKEAKEAYLEELIVRRELSMNFVYFNPDYDQFKCIPDWAQKTLNKHLHDKRESVYTPEQLDQAQTHDPYWNAAQQQMVIAGKMHNYMRMYWGKKVIEWTEKPEDAFNWLLAANNRYEIDGRDANGFTGVAWCFGKHDRPWTERDIFGTVRYMAASGLKRKFKIDNYVSQINRLTSPELF